MTLPNANRRPASTHRHLHLHAWLLALALLVAQSVGVLHRTQHGGAVHGHSQEHTHPSADGHDHEHDHDHADEPHEHSLDNAAQSNFIIKLFSHEQGRDCTVFDAVASGDALGTAAAATWFAGCPAAHPSSSFTSVSAQRLAGTRAARGPPLLAA